MWDVVVNWLNANESVAIWLEGIALVLIFIWDRFDASGQHKEMAKQLALMRTQAETMQTQAAVAQANAAAAKLSAEALVNSERTWVVVSLRPFARKFGGQWHRENGAALSTADVLAWKHLTYGLTLTNLGRGPAQILGFMLTYTCLGEGVTDLPENGEGERVSQSYWPFEVLLPGNGATAEVGEQIDMYWYMKEDLHAIQQLKKTALLHGWVKYRHMLSTTEDCYADFGYVFTVSEDRLNPVGRLTKQRQEKAIMP